MADCTRCGHHEAKHLRTGEMGSIVRGSCRECSCREFTQDRPEIPRDMLLSEIRRSLEATHPDRSGALMAALERIAIPSEPIAARFSSQIPIGGGVRIAFDVTGPALATFDAALEKGHEVYVVNDSMRLEDTHRPRI